MPRTARGRRYRAGAWGAVLLLVTSVLVAIAPAAASARPARPGRLGQPAGAGVLAGHYVFALLGGVRKAPAYQDADAPLLGVTDGQAFRLRFRLRNAGQDALTVTPLLEFRPRAGGRYAAASGRYAAVPEQAKPGSAFYVTREWVPVKNGTGPGPDGAAIPVSGLRVDDGPGGQAVAGHHSMAANPDQPVTLSGDEYTEVEFTLGVSPDAANSTGYEFRLSDGGSALAAAAAAQLRTGPAGSVRLSPGQHRGSPVKTAAPSLARYPLAAPLAAPLAGATAGPDPIHGPYSMTSDACVECHRGHAGAAVNLLTRSGSPSALCLSCHDGTGGPDVATVFKDPAIPANNPADRSYYGHDALIASSHTSASTDEFGGVLNRHSECGDCHNPHRSGGPAATSTATGWTASGALAGISGVSVVNGAAGTAPAYTFLDGITMPISLEYQLCFKCHSGFTVLLDNAGLTPSRYELDKGVEFNPNNPSFHPIEAAGTNQTAAMAASLAGTSPYKRWNFTTTSTISCGNCHASDGAAGLDPATHRSPNRGILAASYRDRVLKSAGEAYAAADFALCYLCHAESPFVSGGGASTATNFPYHSKHVSGLGGEGAGGTDIDTAGAGQGNAICAECHYRIHSATYSVGGQTISGGRLVNFAPNVTANNGVLSWIQGATSGGTCTLICHGQRHDAERY